MGVLRKETLFGSLIYFRYNNPMHNDSKSILVTLIGSFRKNREKLEYTHSIIQESFTLLSPVNIDFIDDENGFVKTKSELDSSIQAIEGHHLDAISHSDMVILHAPNGYVGNSGSMEIGYACALGIPVIADEMPTDATVATIITGLLSDLEKTPIPRVKSGSGINGLQLYYDRVAKRRGWDNESPKDTMLLITEEIGELARAIRKHEGLKRDAGYDGVDVADELADVQLYLVHLANALNIKLSEAVTNKEYKNNDRFNNTNS